MQSSELKMQNDKSKFKTDFTKRLIRFSLAIINLSDELRKNRNRWSLADQLVRSGTSIGANIIEAKAASSKKEYIRFFGIALKSANETLYWLILVKASNPELLEKTSQVYKECEEITKIIGSAILTMKDKNKL